MSFSGSVTIPKGLDPDQVDDALDGLNVSGNDDCPAERSQAVAAAIDAASAVINSGALGETSEYGFVVNVSGHVNPEHRPVKGMSNDGVYVSIGQASP